MRGIEFRGRKTQQDCRWIYGSLLSFRDGDMQICEQCSSNMQLSRQWVISSTVGQHTGLKDKNGVKIFEGDIIKVENSWLLGKTLIGKIKWEPCGFWFEYTNPFHGGGGLCGLSMPDRVVTTVIGNVHENPELLETGEPFGDK